MIDNDPDAESVEQPHRGVSPGQGPDDTSRSFMWVIAVIFGASGSLCLLSGFGSALAAIFSPDALATQPWHEGDPFMRLLLVLLASFQLIVGAALGNYAYILVRRASWKGPGRYDPFRGSYGWFNAIGGLVLSGGVIALSILATIGVSIAQGRLAFEVLPVVMFVFWMFEKLWATCWAGLKRLRSDDTASTDRRSPAQ